MGYSRNYLKLTTGILAKLSGGCWTPGMKSPDPTYILTAGWRGGSLAAVVPGAGALGTGVQARNLGGARLLAGSEGPQTPGIDSLLALGFPDINGPGAIGMDFSGRHECSESSRSCAANRR